MIKIQNPVNNFSRFHMYARDFFPSEKINIPSSFRIKVQNIVIDKLGLRNINELRDRYEGQAYLDKIMLSMASKFILNNYLAEKVILNIDLISSPEKQNIITLKEKIYQLVPFYFGTLPNLTAQSNLPLTFCSLRSDFRNGSVFGYL